MDRFFVNRPNRATFHNVQFDNWVKRYMVDYNRNYEVQTTLPSWVDGNHILMKLVSTIPMNPHITEEFIMNFIDANKNGICKAHGITNYNSYGRLHKNAFYGKRCVVVNCNWRFEMYTDWRKYRPVRVLHHDHAGIIPTSSIEMKQEEENDYAVVGIDLLQLGLMYRGWYKDELAKGGEAMISDSIFISKWVIPNMWPEQVNIAYRNMLFNNAMDVDRNTQTYRPIRHMVDIDESLLNANLSVIRSMNTQPQTVIQSLETLPMITTGNWLEAIPVNVLPIATTHCYWVNIAIYSEWLWRLFGIVRDINTNDGPMNRTAQRIERFMHSNDTLTHAGKVLKPLIEPKANLVLGRMLSSR